MTSIAQYNSFRLGFPALITALCRARGVVSDSLTFECLSSVINLAYIRKKCWNHDDLIVAIRGARRARARSADLPSTSAAPTPAATSAAPSVPAQMDSQRFEAMLQSIHQGQIILLQSPTAQVPQHVEDASSEATIPEPFIVEEEAGETQVRQEATATPERSREVTSNPPTPVIPEDPTAPVLTLNTSPPANPVLHLIDEEGVQTHDTQDQSHEF
ncbi:hypothetical protein GmHk_13G036328 [Glycine max]|nr:hypothetical protein GmHk_13G036328 [Glycine max]